VREQRYFKMKVVWKGGFTHYVPTTLTNLKSQIKFQESLDQVESFDYQEITYKEHYKMVWGEDPPAPKKTRRKKVLDKNT
jgi:hypothetical protein